MGEKYYITTAIAYTSKKPHIGNTYEAILADSIARYKRNKGYDVYFLTGTDEHGQKIQELAEKANMTPKKYVDNIAEQIKGIWDKMNVSYSQFIRTTNQNHEKTVQEIFERLYEQGDIYLGEYEGMYCVPCETFYTETQLIDGKCPDCGRDVKKAKEEAYFLKCSKYQDKLIKYIEENPSFIEPESRKKEIVNNFLTAGLQDLCVSRTSFKWGIPVTFNDKHVIYVWIDALTNYITALGYNPKGSKEEYNKFWPADLQVIGKDILRFHSIYWSIILMALNQPLPKKIYAHGWMLFANDKMSKSKGNVIYADELADIIGVDATRYYCLSEMPYAQDGNITYEEVLNRYNADLANTLGNLVTRTVAMVNKYFDGNVYETTATTKESKELLEDTKTLTSEYFEKMEELSISEATMCAIKLARKANKYIDDTSPWILAKQQDKNEQLKEVLFMLVNTIAKIAIMLDNIMPTTCERILSMIGIKYDKMYETLNKEYVSSKRVKTAEVVFTRLEKNAFEKQEEKKIMEQEKIEIKQEIDYEEFEKLDLKVAKILEVEKIPDAKKLYKLKVSLGFEERTIVSGLVPYYKEEELINKKVVIVANLKPAMLRGVKSQGMLLAAGEGDTVKVLFVDEQIKEGEGVH